MKLTTSLLMFSFLALTQKSHARDLILVENLGDKTQGKVLIDILVEKYKWPRIFINYKARKECSKTGNALLHLCLLKNGDIEVVSEKKDVLERLNQTFSEEE